MKYLACVAAIAACGAPVKPSPPRAIAGEIAAGVPALEVARSGPPADLVARWQLSPRYTKYTDVHGFPILGSANAQDAALREAAYLVHHMIGDRRDILDALVAHRVRFVVMAPAEMTTDVPEHADLRPRDYWDRRARGLGATEARPAVSCGEENLLNLDGDPYGTENILVHELSHAVHQMAMVSIDPTFQARLQQAFDAARAAGRWAHTYAMENIDEYWAEGAQSWFDTNRANDDVHGPIATRAQLVAYDPPLAALLREVYGDGPWRYQRLADRSPAERAHLADADLRRRFVWPTRDATSGDAPARDAPARDATSGDAPARDARARDAPARDAPSRDAPARVGSPRDARARGVLALAATYPGPSAASGLATTLVFENARPHAVSIEWIDLAGAAIAYVTLRPGSQHVQPTYVGHVWRVVEQGSVLGYVTAAAATSTVEVR